MSESKSVIITKDNPSIYKDDSKCINCELCKICCNKKILTSLDMPCVYCGQCILSCPVNALGVKCEYKDVEKVINSNEKIVIAITAPAVKVSLGEAFDMKKGSNIEGKLISSLRSLGFDYVFDVSFSADLNTIEESNELLNRINLNNNLPMFSSCCSSFVKYINDNHKELNENLSSCKSPIEMLSTIIKEYFSKINNLSKNRIVVVAIVPCTSKKYEKTLYKDTDYVVTSSELGVWLKEKNISFNTLKSSKYDKLFNRGSSSGVVYGNSGGVALSILRTIHYMIKGSDKTYTLNSKKLNGYNYINYIITIIDNKKYYFAIVRSLPELDRFIETGEYKKYHFIEVMTCENGCISGGGQPFVKRAYIDKTIKERAKSLNKYDKKNIVRYPYKNKDIINLYNYYLEEIGGELSIKLLHK